MFITLMFSHQVPVKCVTVQCYVLPPIVHDLGYSRSYASGRSSNNILCKSVLVIWFGTLPPFAFQYLSFPFIILSFCIFIGYLKRFERVVRLAAGGIQPERVYVAAILGYTHRIIKAAIWIFYGHSGSHSVFNVDIG